MNLRYKNFNKALRKYRSLQTRLAEAVGAKVFRQLFRKLDILKRRLLRLNRAWKLGLSTAALLAGMGTPANAQLFPASMDLDTLGSNGFVINGIATEDNSGRSVSGAGDLNGDGIDDLIIGAYGADPNGKSYVVFGTATSFANLDLSTLNGSNGFVINGIDGGDRSGISVSGAGDLNGDGIDDLIIGAYGADPNGNDRAGESYVVFGMATPPASLNLSTLNGSNGFVIKGIDRDDESGGSVSGAGDVNGDGIDDLIIGAYLADPNGNSIAGESYVVFGTSTPSASIELSTLNGSNGFVINGIDAFDRSGFSVSGVGDVNGDGIDDLIIGAYRAAPNGTFRAGESYVVFGTLTPPASLNLSSLNGSNGFVINGIDAQDFSGFSVSGAGDVNGDGIDDLMIGAPGADSNGNDRAGESYVVFGTAIPPASLELSTLNGSNGFVINGIDADDGSGVSVSGAGDLNGDGVDDLIIGAPSGTANGSSDAGESYVVFGSNTSPDSLNLSNLNGSNGFVINGIDAFDRSGVSVSGAGDLNGDGVDDLIIGAFRASPNGNIDAGESYVIFGRMAATSIDELVPKLALQLFPNPATEAVFVQLQDLRQAVEISLSLFDVLGRELPVAYERVGSDRLRVDLRDVPVGSYLLRVVVNGEVGVSRVVKE